MFVFTNTKYTTSEAVKVTEVEPWSSVKLTLSPYMEQNTTSVNIFKLSTPWIFRFEPITIPEPITCNNNHEESFIGILSDNEAGQMKKEINLFKQHFDADLTGRNKILFGE